jgi:heme O synthase-like polyprenyltransferase
MLPLLALISLIIVQVPPQHAALFHWAGVVLSLGLLYFGLKLVVQRSRRAARRLLAASITYLPVLFALDAMFSYAVRS